MKKLPILVLVSACSLLSIAGYAAAQDTTTDNVEDPVTKTLVWPDGTRYVGGVVDGKRTGKGTIFWQDGTRFVGQFENDMRNGPGTMILPDGTVYTGFFKDDELVDTESTIAASNSEQEVAMDTEESIAALGDTELPMEADSLGQETPAEPEAEPETREVAQVDQYDTIASEPEPDSPREYENAVQDSSEVAIADAADQVSEEETASAALEDSDPADVNEITETVKEALIGSVDQWAQAWSDQDVNAYLASYADEFSVPGRQSRRTWEALRRTRLTRPSYINLDVEYQRFELVETNTVDVFFRQTYSSNTYSDLTDKVLRMVRDDTGNWKILLERSR